MTYLVGTITDSNPGPALHAVVDPALISNGYVLVDTQTISTRTHKTYKNPAANNPSGFDWFIDFAYTTTGAGTYGSYIFEDYIPATHLAYRGCYAYYYNPDYIETTYYSHHGTNGYTLESASLGCFAGNTSGNYVNRDMNTTTTGFGYWASVTPARVIMINTNQPTAFAYTGVHTPDAGWVANVGSPLAFPTLSIWTGPQGGGGAVMTTRVPKMTGTFYWNNVLGINYNPLSWPYLSGGSAAVTSTRKASPVYVTMNTYRVGTAIDLAIMATDTVVRGDTISIGGAPYVFTTSNGNLSYLMKAV